MALLRASGIESGTLLDFDIVSPTPPSVETADSRTGVNSLKLDPNFDLRYAGWRLDSALSELYVQAAFKRTNTGANGVQALVILRDEASADQLAIGLHDQNDPTAIDISRGSVTGTWLASGGVIHLNTRYCMEVYVKIADAGGVIQVRLDGALIIDFAGDTQQTGNANVQDIIFGNLDGVRYFKGNMDDLIVCDNTGTYTWPNQAGIYPVRPAGAGIYTQFTPSAGANYECVDESAPNDADYNSSSTVDHKDSFAMSDLPFSAGDIYAVKWTGRGKVDGAGNLARLYRIGGADYQGGDQALGAGYTEVTEILEASPDTAAAWGIAEVNGLEAGYVNR
ncbi:MAG: hypothetical protein PHQ60_16430 [Sideroxydans sp.]|nr:hypothetical protein [Sideroxydans sp.]